MKEPSLRDTLYVEELVGPETISTMPEETIRAFQDHGRVKLRLESDLEEAQYLFNKLYAVGVDYDDVVATLELEGISAYALVTMDRYVLVAHLKPGSTERAQELLAEHPMHEGAWAAFDREAVFLSDTEVVFFVEGPDADKSVKAIFDDPSLTDIGHWIPLFDGPLHRVQEAYFWERAGN